MAGGGARAAGSTRSRAASVRPVVVQQGRFAFPDDDPIGRPGRYVVTITNQRRDLEALTRLDPVVASKVVPSIRVVRLAGPTARVTARRVRDWAAPIASSVPGSACLVELTEFDPLTPLAAHAGRRHPGPSAVSGARPRRRADRWTVGLPLLQGLVDELVHAGLAPVPVLRPTMSERQRGLVAAVAYGAGAGVALAVPLGPRWVSGPEPTTDLLGLVYRLRLDPAQTDLLLEAPPDRGEWLEPEELASAVRRIRSGAPWRTVVLVATGVPSIIPRPGSDGLLTVDRPDRRLISSLVVGGGVEADDGPGLGLVYGDFGHRHPLRLTWAGTKRANIRYAGADETLVALGEATRNGVGGASQYHELCRAVARHRLFRGGDHCWGCDQVVRGAQDAGAVQPIQSTWDTVGLVHHITQLVAELRTS
jgi:Beta protein